MPARTSRSPASTRIKPLEHDIQAAFVRWCQLSEGKHPELRLAFAVPNAAKRSFRLASRLKAEGMRAGVWDWWLPVPRGSYSGLVIEFKRPGEGLTPAQRDFGDLLLAEGWACSVCKSTEQAVDVTRDYLGQNEVDLWRVALGDAPTPPPLPR